MIIFSLSFRFRMNASKKKLCSQSLLVHVFVWMWSGRMRRVHYYKLQFWFIVMSEEHSFCANGQTYVGIVLVIRCYSKRKEKKISCKFVKFYGHFFHSVHFYELATSDKLKFISQ